MKPRILQHNPDLDARELSEKLASLDAHGRRARPLRMKAAESRIEEIPMPRRQNFGRMLKRRLRALPVIGDGLARIYASLKTPAARGQAKGQEAAPGTKATVHQFSPWIAPGDGASNGMLYTRELLQELGFSSSIYAVAIDPRLADKVVPFDQLQPAPDDVLLVHHSLGDPDAARLDRLACRRVLVYHNITPPHLLPADSVLPRLATLGREQLRAWADRHAGAIGDSENNSAELHAAGYRNVATIPLLVDVDKLRAAPWNKTFAARWRGARNVLFVGRICENKRQLDLIDMLFELAHFGDVPVRLILAGGTTSETYLERMHRRVHELGLGAQVAVAGKVSDEDLQALYRCADVFVCMSEHEGFGMPLIEAMLHDVPVVAVSGSGVDATMGEGGLLLDAAAGARDTAAAVHMLLSEPALKEKVLAGQRRNLRRFERARVRGQLAQYLQALGVGVPLPGQAGDRRAA
jgi:glycosyltransferase involved in cell wall biosynthesis